MREFRRDLRKEGFEELPGRGKGDHEIWKHPDGRQVTVDGQDGDKPKIGTFKKMLKDAGIREEKYR